MRRLLLIALAAAIAAPPTLSYAQYGGGGGDQDKQAQEAAKKRKRDEEWGDKKAPLPALRNIGPCPYVKTLYDAARYVEFKQKVEASADVGYTGEIQGISAGCAYKGDEPIKVAMQILFELGRGPQAEGRSKTYRYWVAVTDRNRAVLAKKEFELKADFPAGHDRIYKREELDNIVIPRAEATTSGANFEVLVGFDVTPQMAEFNRLGKRFRLNSVGALAAETSHAAR
jgi:hypothetical protein